MKLLLLSYRYLLALVIGVGWFSMAMPYLVSAKSDIMPMLGIFGAPVVIAIIAWLVVPPIKKLITNNK